MKEQNREHITAPTISKKWRDEFLSQSGEKDFNPNFERPLLCLMDEFRKAGDRGVYNTAEKFVGKRNLAHLNVEAKPGDEYDSAAMDRFVSEYQKYKLIVQILWQRAHDSDEKKIFDSVPLFTFLMRDFLTNENHRIIDDEPLIAAAKLAALSIYRLMEKATRKNVDSANEFIRFIERRMAANVTSALAHLCHEILPAEAERCGLHKEAVMGDWVDKVRLVSLLEELPPDALDLEYIADMTELKYRIQDVESIIDDGQVFCYDTDEQDGYYVLRKADDGRYFQQDIRNYDDWGSGFGLELVDNEELVAAILDLAISPITLTEEELKESSLAA